MNDNKRTVIGWVKAHPGRAAWTIFGCMLMAFLAGYFDSLKAYFAVGFLIFVVAFIFEVQHYLKGISVLLLLAIGLQGLNADPPKETDHQASGQIACAIVVLVVGGIVTYQLGKWCSKKFPKTPPKDTNAPPEQSASLMAAPADDYAASASTGCDSCWIPDGMAQSLPEHVTSYEMTGELTPDGELRISSYAIAPIPEGREDATMTGPEFVAAIATHGIQLADRYGEKFFGLNGRPATQEEVPIHFVQNPDFSISVQVGVGPFVRAVFEKSPDLVTWYPLLNVGLSPGQRTKYTDLNATEQMFYRLRRVD